MSAVPVTVSAAVGPLPETVEQLKSLAAQGATSVEIVVTDAQAVDVELLELVELELRDLAQANGLAVASLTRS